MPLDRTGTSFGRYRLESKLGAGGFGEVWKAWDAAVGRWVALKILKHADEPTIARFRREATLAASLDHPNIASIYEIGDHDGTPFIAMQFVDGHPLRADSTNLRDHAANIRTAANALHIAHERGIVHRDLKPDNLMIDKDGRVYVMDFGLAKLTSVDSSLSQSGYAIGTPAFMPPEQARGEVHAADARSDVYSLGATLFALATGRPPFDGTNAIDVLMQVATEDTPTPTTFCPAMDPNFETIILKCLEKDPARRYPTAKALADDLDRWLAGDSISARRASIGFLLARGAKRRAGIIVVAVVALAVIATALLLFRKTEAGAADTAEALLKQMREISDVRLSAALDLRRNGDLAGMHRHADEVMRSCDAVLAKRADLAEPRYRKGRMLRALMRDADALEQQNEALRLEPTHPGALYERIILRSRAALDRIHELGAAATRESILTAILKADIVRANAIYHSAKDFGAKDPVLKGLLRAIEADAAALETRAAELPAANLACARAYRRWIAGDLKGALDLVKEATPATPTIEEAWEAVSEIALQAARASDAVQLWSAALDRDRGYLPFHEGFGRALRDLGRHAEAIAAFDTVLAADPRRIRTLLLRGDTRLSWAMLKGAPADAAELAVVDYSAALTLDDRAPDNWVRRAAAGSRAAAWIIGLDQDAEPIYTAAIRDFDEAAKRAPERRDIVRLRATSQLALANMRVSMLKEPGPALDRAVADIDALLAEPAANLFYLRGQCGITRGLHLINDGIDAREPLDRAVADYEKAMELDPSEEHRQGRVHALTLRGAAWHEEDPTPWNRRAEADFEVLLKMPDAGLLVTRGEMRVNWSKWVSRTGGDPEPLIRSAIADCDAAAGLQPQPIVHVTRGMAWYQMALRDAELKREPLPSLEAAAKDYDAAIPSFPARVDLREHRGAVRTMMAGRLVIKGKDPEPVARGAIEDFDIALKVRPKRSTSWSQRGYALQTISGYRVLRGKPAQDELNAAIDSFTRAMELDPSSATAMKQAIAACRMFLKRK